MRSFCDRATDVCFARNGAAERFVLAAEDFARTEVAGRLDLLLDDFARRAGVRLVAMGEIVTRRAPRRKLHVDHVCAP